MARGIPFSRGTVAAIVVARGMTPELRSLLDALVAQSRAVDHLIVCDVRAPELLPWPRDRSSSLKASPKTLC